LRHRIFLSQDKFKKDIRFASQTYEFNEKQERGPFTFYIYAPEGQGHLSHGEIILISKVDSNIPESQWGELFKPVLNMFNLETLNPQGFKFAGYKKLGGFYHSSYATSLEMNGEKVIAFYQDISANDSQGLSQEPERIMHSLSDIYFQ